MIKGKFKVKKGRQIKCGDFLVRKLLRGGTYSLEIADPKKHRFFNGLAAEDLNNVDGSAYIDLQTGKVYNSPDNG